MQSHPRARDGPGLTTAPTAFGVTEFLRNWEELCIKRKTGLPCARKGGAESACPAVSMAEQGSSPHGSRGNGYKDPREGRGPSACLDGSLHRSSKGSLACWASRAGRLHAPPNRHCKVLPFKVAPGPLAQPLDCLLFCPDLGSWDRDWHAEGNL